MSKSSAFASAIQLAESIRHGHVTSVELVERYQQRMARHNPALNAVIYTDWENALEQARRCDEHAASADRPLHGVPMTVKEAIDVAGTPSTWGVEALADNIPRDNAASVDRLLAAGAIIMGKTNVPSLVADHQTFNPIHGRTNNPWDLSRTPGGSSGGAAAAVAAGLTSFELGSDIAGSLRQPAHCCGIYSHKPTQGVCSTRGHHMPDRQVPLDMCVVGPMARSVEDLATGLSVLAGPDSMDSAAWRLELPQSRGTFWKDWRIGILMDDAVAPVDSEVQTAIQKLADFAAAQGARVTDRVRPVEDTGAAYDLFVRLLRSATTSQLTDQADADNQRKAGLLSGDDMSYKARTLRGRTMSHRAWLLANEARHQVMREWDAFFDRYDLLLCPAACRAASVHDQTSEREDRVFNISGQWLPSTNDLFWAGLTGMVYLPSTVVPIGTTRDELPIGVQIAGQRFDDRSTLAFASLLEKEFRAFIPPPGFDD